MLNRLLSHRSAILLFQRTTPLDFKLSAPVCAGKALLESVVNHHRGGYCFPDAVGAHRPGIQFLTGRNLFRRVKKLFMWHVDCHSAFAYIWEVAVKSKSGTQCLAYCKHTHTHTHTCAASQANSQNKELVNLGWLSLKISLFSVRHLRVFYSRKVSCFN